MKITNKIQEFLLEMYVMQDNFEARLYTEEQIERFKTSYNKDI